MIVLKGLVNMYKLNEGEIKECDCSVFKSV